MTSKTEKEVIYLPGGNGAESVEGQELLPALDDMTPREIVAELDKYIVGQGAAKRAVAVGAASRARNARNRSCRAAGTSPAHARKVARPASRRKAGPAHGGSGSSRTRHALVRNRVQPGRRGNGHWQTAGHVLRHVRAAKEKTQNERGRRF